ncbi:MAG: hypothetical protein P8020_21385, partial [Acidobacteriota bacterium]
MNRLLSSFSPARLPAQKVDLLRNPTLDFVNTYCSTPGTSWEGIFAMPARSMICCASARRWNSASGRHEDS